MSQLMDELVSSQMEDKITRAFEEAIAIGLFGEEFEEAIDRAVARRAAAVEEAIERAVAKKAAKKAAATAAKKKVEVEAAADKEKTDEDVVASAKKNDEEAEAAVKDRAANGMVATNTALNVATEDDEEVSGIDAAERAVEGGALKMGMGDLITEMKSSPLMSLPSKDHTEGRSWRTPGLRDDSYGSNESESTLRGNLKRGGNDHEGVQDVQIEAVGGMIADKECVPGHDDEMLLGVGLLTSTNSLVTGESKGRSPSPPKTLPTVGNRQVEQGGKFRQEAKDEVVVSLVSDQQPNDSRGDLRQDEPGCTSYKDGPGITLIMDAAIDVVKRKGEPPDHYSSKQVVKVLPNRRGLDGEVLDCGRFEGKPINKVCKVEYRDFEDEASDKIGIQVEYKDTQAEKIENKS